MTVIDAELLAAYQRTDYAIFEVDAETVVRIGRADPAIDGLLTRHGAERGTIITAWNPESVILSDAENAARETELWKWIGENRLFALAAEGRDPTGAWQPEQSCLILDIAADAVATLGRQYGQNAIVHLRLGAAPELELLR
ncbi:MAG TPA: DUF3293 domain-containing protein [Dongiaceae bacterium]|nr:DUF3293 domain-containing protein [Dongiaceae bacterium]